MQETEAQALERIKAKLETSRFLFSPEELMAKAKAWRKIEIGARKAVERGEQLEPISDVEYSEDDWDC